MQLESEKIEYKLQMTEEVYKEVIAFANTDGGIIYIGVDDNGNEVGIEQVDETYTRITNGIRDAIKPDVTMFVKYQLENNKIIKIMVGEGTYKPYYLQQKGLKPSGVYIRQGASSVPASAEQIRQMIKLADGDIFENTRSMEQELTFAQAEEAFKYYGVDFAEDKYVALGMRKLEDGLYTNLAFLLSDQCRHTIKVAVFDNENNTIFRDAKEFGGSLFRQLEDTYEYLQLCNRTKAEFHGLERIEKEDYPQEVLREALLNSIVHRDYSYSGSIIINVNEKKMEFISLGGLLPGLEVEDIKNGISQPRNKNLAEVFHRLKLIESYGTGIRRIYNLYKDCNIQPQLIVTANSFKLILPNRNQVVQIENEKSVKVSSNITAQMEVILEYLHEKQEINEEEVQQLLNIKRTRAYTLMKKLQDENLVIGNGRGKNKKYFLK